MKKLVLAFGLFCFATPLQAADISVSMADIPNLAAKNGDQISGNLYEVLKIVDDHYADGNFTYDVYPFARSINNVISGNSDVHAPLINTGKAAPPDFQYVDEPLQNVTFVIYSHKDNPVTADSDFASLKIETLIDHAQFFDFKVDETKSLENALKKVMAKRTDAFIMEQAVVDGVVRANNMDKIHRALFAEWGSSMIVKNGPDGDKMKAALTAAVKKAKGDERYAAAANALHQPYDDWQP